MQQVFITRLGLMALISAVICVPAIAAPDPFFCSPTRKQICNSDKPCQTAPTGEFYVFIDDETNSYTRCETPDRASCSTYGMVKSGNQKNYMTFEMTGRGAFSKIGPDGDWAEVVSLGDMLIVSHGMCFRESALRK